jgi:prepilin-type N-terminal cleavage/methylation domain-containing protein
MSKNKSGVTLIELVVALGLFSILTLLVFSVLSFSSRSFNIQASDIENVSNVRNAVSHITNEIRKADSISISDNVLTIDGSDEYKLLNNSITKNGQILFDNIEEFNIVRSGNKIDIEVASLKGRSNKGYRVTTTIYIR